MSYVTVSDFTITQADIDKATAMKPDVVDTSIAIGLEYVRDRIIHLYDVDAVYADTANRRMTLVQIIVKIAQFYMIRVAPQINVPQAYINDYEEALEFLNQIECGKLLTDLPSQVDEDIKLNPFDTSFGECENNIKKAY